MPSIVPEHGPADGHILAIPKTTLLIDKTLSRLKRPVIPTYPDGGGRIALLELQKTLQTLKLSGHTGRQTIPSDRNPNDTASEERFKSIQNAYDMIGSSESRREDQQKEWRTCSAGGFLWIGSGFDFSDIFSQFMGGRGGSDFGFDSRAGRARHSQSSQCLTPGADIEAGLDVTLEEAASGTEKKFSHRRLKRCEKCDGDSFGTSRTCSKCNGTGVQTKGSTISVKVPAGAIHGQQLRLRKMGHEHPQGESGDLLITLRLDARRAGDGRRGG